MVFSSLIFLMIFLPLLLIIYYITPSKKSFTLKNIVLLIFSLLFYSWGEPIYVSIMLFSSIVDFTIGNLIEKFPKKKRIWLILSIIVNLGMLFTFKYTDFFITNINNLFNVDIPLLKLALPIGISFFTFQTMSYSIDVFLGNTKAEKNFLNFFLYVSMFPQLIAGPIVRYTDVAKELKERTITLDKVASGFKLFLYGLFKKVLIANNLGLLFDSIKVMDSTNLTFVLSWVGIIAYTLQIYFDFSGYSNMASGLGRMLGFTYPENFNYPYISKSIKEFWSRWHITLSSFFKDYIYIPLGGSRCKLSRNIFNLLLVWMLTGFWHGAEWNYILWGLYFGIILMLERYILNKVLDKLPNVLKHIYALILILVGWLIFTSNDIMYLNDYLKSLLCINVPFINNYTIELILSNLSIIIIGSILSTPIYKVLSNKINNINNKVLKVIINILITLSIIILFIITLAYLVSNSYNPFLYFRF